jgi:hypothetical protein
MTGLDRTGPAASTPRRRGRIALYAVAGGGVLAVLGRWSGRALLKRVALVVLAMGVGIVAGEGLARRSPCSQP